MKPKIYIMAHNATVKVVTLKNIDDKEMHYLVIENEKGKVNVNIGQKTLDNVKKLLEPKK